MKAATELHEAGEGILIWQAYDPSVKADLTACAITTEAGLLLVDPIPLARGAIDELLSFGNPVEIVLTSGNHERAAAEYRDRFLVPVSASAEAAAALTIPADRALSEGDRIGDTLTVHLVQGAGPGEIALHHVGGSLHLGDAVINLEAHGFSLLPDKYCSDPRQMRASLRKLLRLEFSLLTFAHGLPVVTKAHERLAQLLA